MFGNKGEGLLHACISSTRIFFTYYDDSPVCKIVNPANCRASRYVLADGKIIFSAVSSLSNRMLDID